ncbi:MAG TPA: aminotransferase class I/II-fold pyridoxal phosphate-dependent enzyme, partial [Propionibacteriaceae bacterium]|nr:aminotransferase class I/II-fold pyridoxal phosphate-dependent enzyme [Propionibacteriaceae bacterium]
DRAEDAAAAFDGSVERYTYSRFNNPTVTAFAERLADMEGAEACFPVASGMAGVFGVLIALLSQGDRVVASRHLFGSCYSVLSDILPRFGVVTEFVDGTDLEQWREALRRPAKAVFFESPANPMQEIVDIAAVSELAHAAGALVIADNAMASPAIQSPTRLGADVVVYSTTKHIDGQGRTLGGAILGADSFINGPVKTLVRNTGPTMSPFTAWVALKGLETLRLRVEHASATALTVARSLEANPRVAWVRYPFLESHPQHDLARRQMSAGGTIVTFAIDGGRDEAFAAINALTAFDISNNFGDAKSMVTHPATTTHYRIGPEARARVGITDGTIRLSIGLEDADDIVSDLNAALG